MSDTRTGPGRTGYVIAAAFALLGIAIAVIGAVVSVRSVMSLSDGLHRFAGPGLTHIDVQETGTYKVYHEHQSVLDGQTYRNPPGPPANLVLRVTKSSDGTEVPVEAAMGETYSFGSAEGTSVWQFDAAEAGRYNILITSADNVEQDPGTGRYVFAVGRAMLPGICATVGGIFCSIGGAIIGLLAAGVIALVTFLRRRSAARAAAVAGSAT